MFIAKFSNVNGPTTKYELSAKTLLGAKRESYKMASGDTTAINIYLDGCLQASRYSSDSFHGFCRGAQKWFN